MGLGLSETVFRGYLLLTATVRGKSLWMRKCMGLRNRETKGTGTSQLDKLEFSSPTRDRTCAPCNASLES